MEINRNNYETYFIDYLEGNLNELLVNDFIEFLQQNPDLKEELSHFETLSVEPENILFSKKNNLYKDKYDSEKEFSRAAVANLEGDISDIEKAEFDHYILTHPNKQKDITIFSKTKLLADESITFNKKNKLYRYSLGRTLLLWSGRVAAVLVLAFAFFIIVNNSSNRIIPDHKIALVEEKTEKETVNQEVKKLPVKTEQKETEELKEITPKPAAVKVKSAPKSKKSLRENTSGRMNHEDLVILRTPIEVPAELNRITASLNIQQPTTSLATMHRVSPDVQPDFYEERLLADIIIEKTGIDKFQFNKITKAGLNLVSNITNDNFTYETNKEGKITEYNFESRLVAFSIPSKNADSK